MILSDPPERARRPSDEIANVRAGPAEHFTKGRTCCPVSKSHRRTIPSLHPVTARRPSGSTTAARFPWMPEPANLTASREFPQPRGLVLGGGQERFPVGQQSNRLDKTVAVPHKPGGLDVGLAVWLTSLRRLWSAPIGHRRRRGRAAPARDTLQDDVLEPTVATVVLKAQVARPCAKLAIVMLVNL